MQSRSYRIMFLRALSMISRAFLALFDKNAPKPYVSRHLLRRYILDGKAAFRYYYLNDTLSIHHPIIHTSAQVDYFIEEVSKRKQFYYGETDEWLYQALDEFGISGKKVAIFGSKDPVYESICLFYGGRPITIEYRKIIVQDSRLVAMTPEDYDKNPIQFEAAFSISSFEHDGLGRYGDPLCPEGDLIAMEKAKQMLKPNGIFYLSVPVGKDALVWNAGRVYGKNRLPLLLKGWEVIKTFGFKEGMLTRKCGLQPVFVLKNCER